MSKKRDQLVQAGERLFVKHGLRRISVEEICAQAGVSRPTFYKYFENKESLARWIVDMWVAEVLEKVHAIQAAEMPFPEKLQQILLVKQELSKRPGKEFMEDLIALNIDLAYAYQEVMRFFADAQRDGDIRSDMSPEFLLACFDVINRLQHDPRVRATYNDPEKLAGDVFELFYFGALSSRNRKAGLPNNNVSALLE